MRDVPEQDRDFILSEWTALLMVVLTSFSLADGDALMGRRRRRHVRP